MTQGRVQQLLDDIRSLSEERYRLVVGLRERILTLSPDISEEVKYGGLLYSSNTPFCGIFAYSQHVSVEFSEGAALADPLQVLEGQGKIGATSSCSAPTRSLPSRCSTTSAGPTRRPVPGPDPRKPNTGIRSSTVVHYPPLRGRSSVGRARRSQ